MAEHPAERRTSGIREVQRILLDYRPVDTPVALVRHALRAGERVTVTTQGGFLDTADPVDMATLVIVGNRQTTRFGDLLVSRRVPPAVRV